MVTSNHSVYSNSHSNSTLDSTSQAIAHDDFMRSCNLVIGYLADIIIKDITAGQRNWCVAEIGPHRQNPLYGSSYLTK